MVAGRPEMVAGRPEMVAGRPETVAGRPETVAGRPETIPGRPEMVPGRPEMVPGRPATFPVRPATVPQPAFIPLGIDGRACVSASSSTGERPTMPERGLWSKVVQNDAACAVVQPVASLQRASAASSSRALW